MSREGMDWLTEKWKIETHREAVSAYLKAIDACNFTDPKADIVEFWDKFATDYIARAAVQEVADVISRMNCPQSCWYTGPARDGYCTAMHQVLAALKADKGE